MEEENKSALTLNGIKAIIGVILLITIMSAVINNNGYKVRPKVLNGQVVVERYDENGKGEEPKGIMTILQALKNTPLAIDINKIRTTLNTYNESFRKLGDSSNILKVVIDIFYYIQQIGIQIQVATFMVWNAAMYTINIVSTLILT